MNGGGGNGGSSQGLGYENGTRLRARVVSTDDGARQFVGWRDTELEFDCAFNVAEDGARRCLPTVLIDPTLSPDTYFADAGCSTPVVVLVGCDNDPKYAVRIRSNVCPAEYEITRLGPRTETVFSGTPGDCNEVSSPSFAYEDLGAEPAASFVEGTESVE